MCVDATNRNCTANVDCTRLGFTADNGKVPRVENMGLTVNREHYTINNLARNNRTYSEDFPSRRCSDDDDSCLEFFAEPLIV